MREARGGFIFDSGTIIQLLHDTHVAVVPRASIKWEVSSSNLPSNALSSSPCQSPVTNKDDFWHEAIALVSQPSSAYPLRVHIWARSYDQGEASLNRDPRVVSISHLSFFNFFDIKRLRSKRKLWHKMKHDGMGRFDSLFLALRIIPVVGR